MGDWLLTIGLWMIFGYAVSALTFMALKDDILFLLVRDVSKWIVWSIFWPITVVVLVYLRCQEQKAQERNRYGV